MSDFNGTFWSRFRRRREQRDAEARPPAESGAMPATEDPMPLRRSLHDPERRGRAILIVKRGLAQAEEKYLVAPDATLGTWFARAAETVAVAARVVLERLEEGHRPEEAGIAGEQLGLFADICAEAIRATSQVWGESPTPQAREEIVDLISASPRTLTGPSWVGTLGSLAQCVAALEPLANGLRDGDLPMGEPTDCDRVAEALLEVAIHALQAIDALC